MERITLYINNEYCLTLEQLKGYFKRDDLKPGSRLYDELLTLQCDGMLQQWLEQGATDDEQQLARQLNAMHSGLTNSELMGELVRLFTGHGGTIDKPQASTFLDLLAVECRANGRQVSLTSSGKHQYAGSIDLLEMNTPLPKVQVSLAFKIKKKDNEQFNVRLMASEGKMLNSVTLSLRDHRVGATVNLDFVPVQLGMGATALTVTVDGEPWAALQLDVNNDRRTFIVDDMKFNMIYVKGGTFTMGEQGRDASSDEKPAHQVTLSSYYIGETPVTQELWQAVMGNNPSKFNGGSYGIDLQRPVESVSWDDCQAFIAKLNKKLASQLGGRRFRLPTEAQWEFAARGGTKSKHHQYAGSDDIDAVAWYSSNSNSRTHPVAQKTANELGLFDMIGNVSEWCQDGLRTYDSSPQTDPLGPTASGSFRVSRGGSWGSSARYCRVSYRVSNFPSDANIFRGLRLAL